jgi:hypothetical protein
MKKSKCLACGGEIVTTSGMTVALHGSWQDCAAALNKRERSLPSPRVRRWDAEVKWVGENMVKRFS